MSSENNAADRASRLNSTPEDLGLGSVWQFGPAYLKLPVGKWPKNRDFASRKSKMKVSIEEVRRTFRSQVTLVQSSSLGFYLVDQAAWTTMSWRSLTMG